MMSSKVYAISVDISDEAIFDYENMGNGSILYDELKYDLEEYIGNQMVAGRLLGCKYFRVKYYDETINEMLELFLYRTLAEDDEYKWELVGICFYQDWNEKIENNGQIRLWLNTKLTENEEESSTEESCIIKS